MIKTTRWIPNTCSCVLNYTWDTDVPEDSRTHTISNFESICSKHASYSDDTSRFNQVVQDNQKGN